MCLFASPMCCLSNRKVSRAVMSPSLIFICFNLHKCSTVFCQLCWQPRHWSEVNFQSLKSSHLPFNHQMLSWTFRLKPIWLIDLNMSSWLNCFAPPGASWPTYFSSVVKISCHHLILLKNKVRFTTSPLVYVKQSLIGFPPEVEGGPIYFSRSSVISQRTVPKNPSSKCGSVSQLELAR